MHLNINYFVADGNSVRFYFLSCRPINSQGNMQTIPQRYRLGDKESFHPWVENSFFLCKRKYEWFDRSTNVEKLKMQLTLFITL